MKGLSSSECQYVGSCLSRENLARATWFKDAFGTDGAVWSRTVISDAGKPQSGDEALLFLTLVRLQRSPGSSSDAVRAAEKGQS